MAIRRSHFEMIRALRRGVRQGLLRLRGAGMLWMLVLVGCAGLAQAQPQWEFVGLENHSVSHLFTHPTNPEILFAIATARRIPEPYPGLLRSSDSGETWAAVLDTSSAGYYFIFDMSFHPANPDTVFCSSRAFSPNMYLMSTTGGISWFGAATNLQFGQMGTVSVRFSYLPNSDVFLADATFGSGGRLYRSDDGGREFDWVRDFTSSGAFVSVQTFAGHPQEIFVIPEGPRSTNGGETWGEYFDSYVIEVTDICASRSTGSPLYAAMSVLVQFPEFRATLAAIQDGERTWTDIRELPRLTFLSMTVHPHDSNLIIIGNAFMLDSIWHETLDMTTDGGFTWTAMMDAPFFGNRTNCLAFNTDGTVLYIGLKAGIPNPAGGLWRWHHPSSMREADNNMVNSFHWKVAPNPVNGDIRLTFDFENVAVVGLGVYDVLGRLVSSLPRPVAIQGRHTMMIDASGLSSGMYWLVLRTGTQIESQRVVILK